jgi:hypothetical protein
MTNDESLPSPGLDAMDAALARALDAATGMMAKNVPGAMDALAGVLAEIRARRLGREGVPSLDTARARRGG